MASVKQVGKAMGGFDGDYLTIKNQWASVTIERYVGDGESAFVLYGDAMPDDSRPIYQSLGAAIAESLSRLALFEEGRA
jgi:hypothetical protein